MLEAIIVLIIMIIMTTLLIGVPLYVMGTFDNIILGWRRRKTFKSDKKRIRKLIPLVLRESKQEIKKFINQNVNYLSDKDIKLLLNKMDDLNLEDLLKK